MMRPIKNVLMFAFLFAGTMSFAQQNEGFRPEGTDVPRQRPAKFVLQELNLSADQMKSLDQIQRNYDSKDSIAFVEFRHEREKGRADRMKAFKSVLNREQQEKLDNILLMHADREIFHQGKVVGKRFRPSEMNQEEERAGELRPNFQEQGKKLGKCEHPEKSCCMSNHDHNMEKMKMQPNADSVKRKPEWKKTEAGMKRGSQNIKDQKSPQANFTPAQQAQKQTQRLNKFLQLNNLQVAKIYQINLRYARKSADNKDITKNYRQQQEVRSVLNVSQKARYNVFLHRENRMQ